MQWFKGEVNATGHSWFDVFTLCKALKTGFLRKNSIERHSLVTGLKVTVLDFFNKF